MTPRVIVHGGVDSEGPAMAEGLRRAAEAGLRVLDAGGDAVTAAEMAVRALESDALFNAGVGSVLNEDGEVETDSGIVDGFEGRFAGVAALRGVRHPVSVAAELLRRAPGPVLLAGDGAARFARRTGAREDDLRTVEQREIWSRARRGDAVRSPFTGRELVASDTVGAIVCDAAGHIAAASSTGGLLLKMPGRVGDAAVFGAGIYADARRAVLCSGLGEAAIELNLALRTALDAERSDDLDGAVAAAVGRLAARGATGGVVLFSTCRESPAVAHNAADFPVVLATADGHLDVPARTPLVATDG